MWGCGGLGSDLLESYVGAIASAVILAFHLYLSSEAKRWDIPVI